MTSDLRTRRRLLEATLADLAAGGGPGAVARAGAAIGIDARRAALFFPHDDDAVLALYLRLADDLARDASELVGGTVADRFAALVRRKLALLAPWRAPLTALLARALDPRHRVGVLAAQTELVRERVADAFRVAVLGADDAPAAPADAALARALYALHLALVALWMQDGSDGAAATDAVVDIARDGVALARRGLRWPGAGRGLARLGAALAPFVDAPADPAATASAEAILRVVFAVRRSASGDDACRRAPCPRCYALHVGRVRRSVLAAEPVTFVLPAFPAKSPSPMKTLGPDPDLADELGLEALQRLCERIGEIHAPGARVILCSDGGVFADLVGVGDGDVERYGRALDAIIARRRFTALTRFALEDLYDDPDAAARRAAVVAHYADPAEAVAERARAGAGLALFNGIHRFLVEDREGVAHGLSRTRLKETCKGLALEVIRRSEAWGRLVADCFPLAVRLSIHPQDPHAAKIGVRLAAAADEWLTPWHAVALERDGAFSLVHRRDAERAGARLVERDGRPSHYRVETRA